MTADNGMNPQQKLKVLGRFGALSHSVETIIQKGTRPSEEIDA